jgi:hypothetical protein
LGLAFGVHQEICMLRSIWTCSSATVVLFAAFLVGEEWVAQTGLSFILFILFVAGIALFIVGVRDLIRDLAHFFYTRSHKDDHA